MDSILKYNNDWNTRLFEVLNNIMPITTSRVSMVSWSNIYAHPPFLRFKFQGTRGDEAIYSDLKELLNLFNGNLQWTIVKEKNFIIIPVDFVKWLNHSEEIRNKKDMLLIDKGILDIPKLSEHIRIGLDRR